MRKVSFSAFDTFNTIQSDASDDLLRQAVGLCMEIHANFNRFSSDGLLAKINSSEDEWVRCDPGMAYVLRVAKALYEETGGAYDVAVAPIMDLWNFKDEDFCVPSGARVREALKGSGMLGVEVVDDAVRIPCDVRIDLGSIAKGYAADAVANLLLEEGATTFCLNFGGTVLAFGKKPDGTPWTFGLQEPYAAYGERFWAVLECCSGAFATSGSYERGMTVEGERYHHIVDPRTGMPVDNGLLEVTVHAGSAMMADALSTALFAMGSEKGLPLLCDLGAKALIRFESGRVAMSEGFPAKLVGGDHGLR